MTETTGRRLSFKDAHRHERCPACDSAALRPYRTSVDYHYQVEGEFATDRCGGCGLILLNPMPTAADLGSLYPEDYYSYETPALRSGIKQTIKRWVGLEKRTLLPRFAAPGTMLDVGCGAGQYLIEMQAQGWRVYGSELNPGGAAAGARAGLEIRPGEITSAGFAPQSFDFIRLNHSFEHIPDPAPVLAEIRKLLKPDGKLFIGVPNVDGLMARIFGRYWWYVGLPVHTYGYNPASLSRLLARHGFRVERLRYYSDYGGVLGSLQIFLNRNERPRRSDGAVVQNMVLRLPAQYLARLLDFLRVGDCIEVIASVAPGPRQ